MLLLVMYLSYANVPVVRQNIILNYYGQTQFSQMIWHYLNDEKEIYKIGDIYEKLSPHCLKKKIVYQTYTKLFEKRWFTFINHLIFY